ncbi:hypothetical protein GCM10022296_26760 [Secundilactobacillus similis DSM 23365 = JCM 2765]
MILVFYSGRMPREAPALCEAGTQWRAYELGMAEDRHTDTAEPRAPPPPATWCVVGTPNCWLITL